VDTLPIILFFGLAMAVVALVGGVTLFFSETVLERLLLPMVALASGSLIGGAFFHLLPHAAREGVGTEAIFLWLAAGFVCFFLLDQVLHWQHSHRAPAGQRKPVGTMVLIADALHNLLGGVAVGSVFISDIRLGVVAWLIAAAHELPQELGDFGVLVHSGWSPRQALVWNFCSALAFPLGGVLTYLAAGLINLDVMVPFAAGNFLYIGAADLIPEFRQGNAGKANLVHTFCWLAGISILLSVSFL